MVLVTIPVIEKGQKEKAVALATTSTRLSTSSALNIFLEKTTANPGYVIFHRSRNHTWISTKPNKNTQRICHSWEETARAVPRKRSRGMVLPGLLHPKLPQKGPDSRTPWNLYWPLNGQWPFRSAHTGANSTWSVLTVKSATNATTSGPKILAIRT